jgi:hypothetical protein
LKIAEEPIVNRFAGRRKSVFAEQYDPEEDEEEENNKVIFPKTDEQRTRLCDSVKNILLFRALDPEQVNPSHPSQGLIRCNSFLPLLFPTLNR